jgi:hypothetical protein
LKEADGAEDAKCREKVQQSGGRQQGREMLWYVQRVVFCKIPRGLHTTLNT